MPKFIFDNVPFPPSVNEMYATVVNPKFISYIRKGGNPKAPKKPPQTYRILTQKAHAYKAQVNQWAIFNSELVSKASDALKGQLLFENKMLEIRSYFCLPSSDVWYKNGKIKKSDAANRLKALHDSLSDILDIDDKYFYPGISPKVVLAEDRKSPCVLIIIEPKPIMNWEDLKNQEIRTVTPSSPSTAGSESAS